MSMALFSTLSLKIAPLYMSIFMGFIAGKWLNPSRDDFARLIFYIIAPLIMFNGILATQMDASILSLPLLTWFLSSMLCLLFYQISKRYWSDTSRNLVAFSAGTANTGYFGIPLALMLFDTQGEGIYMMALLGMTLYENSLGFYICAQGIHTQRECLIKLLKLPMLYAFLAGLTVNVSGIPIPSIFVDFMEHVKGAYTVLGMMLIGLSLSTLRKFSIDMKFIGVTFFAKFLAWPTMILALIAMDTAWFGIYSEAVHQALILISIVPLAVNMVILATVFKTQPEKAATAVLLSAIFALVYVPLMVIFFIQPEL